MGGNLNSITLKHNGLFDFTSLLGIDVEFQVFPERIEFHG